MMTTVKKNYASIMEVQEGNMVPKDKQLDVKGIAVLHKSSSPISTRKALQKILLEDILNAPAIDQLRFVKDIAILEKQIVNSIKSGSKEYYKPATIKSQYSYDDPMRIQGIKASIAWNMIRTDDLPAIDLEERNGIDIAKVNISKANVDIIKDKYPEVYNNILNLFERTRMAIDSKTKQQKEVKDFKDGINAIAIPLDVNVPEWLFEFIDTNTIIQDNISGFPFESIGIQSYNRTNVTYTNIVKL